MNIIKRYPMLCTLVCIFVYFLIMGILLPLNHDDWSWYVDGKRQMFDEHFSKLNGRYLGNSIELLAVYIAPIRWFIYAGTSLGVIWYLLKITQVKQNMSMLLLVFAGILIIPGEIFKQTYGWFAGFNNYVIGALCVLVILYTIIKTIQQQEVLSLLESIIFYLACLAGQLFMENYALFNSFILFCAVVYYFYLNKKINLRLLAGFLLGFIGMMIMFLNPNYLNILQGKSHYQSVAQSGTFVSKAGAFVLNIVPQFIFFKQYLIIMIIVAVTLYLLSRSTKFKAVSVKRKTLVIIGLVLLPLYRTLIYASFDLETMNHALLVSLINFLVCFTFVVVFVYALQFIAISKVHLYVIYFMLFTMIFLHLPLMIAAPLGPRNFYSAYIIWLIILVVLVESLQLNTPAITKLFGSFVIIFSVVMIAIFSSIAYTNTQRIHALKAQASEHKKHQTITVTLLPFDSLMQRSSPSSANKIKDFKTYWGVPQNVEIKFVPYGTKIVNK